MYIDQLWMALKNGGRLEGERGIGEPMPLVACMSSWYGKFFLYLLIYLYWKNDGKGYPHLLQLLLFFDLDMVHGEDVHWGVQCADQISPLICMDGGSCLWEINAGAELFQKFWPCRGESNYKFNYLNLLVGLKFLHFLCSRDQAMSVIQHILLITVVSVQTIITHTQGKSHMKTCLVLHQ